MITKLRKVATLHYKKQINVCTSRVEEVNPEYMMERSFHQFQNYSNIPQVKSLKLPPGIFRERQWRII